MILSTRETSLESLKAHPAAWALVAKMLPAVRSFSEQPDVAAFIGNVSLYELAKFGVITTEKFAALDAQFVALGKVP